MLLTDRRVHKGRTETSARDRTESKSSPRSREDRARWFFQLDSDGGWRFLDPFSDLYGMLSRSRSTQNRRYVYEEKIADS